MGQAVKEFQKAKDEFTDELHKTGPDQKTATPAPSTIAQNTPVSGEIKPDPNRANPPGQV